MAYPEVSLTSYKSRAAGRRGLYTMDGKPLRMSTIRAAYAGVESDIDMIHLSVRDMIFGICHADIDKITMESDLEYGFWSTEQYDEAGRYADDIISDWRAHGGDTIESLYDATRHYIRAIRHTADHIPDRMLRNDDWMFTIRHGTAPKSIYPPSDPPEYTLGEGHSVVPDGITHPLIAHLASSEPCTLKAGKHIHGAMPHRLAGCRTQVRFASGGGELPAKPIIHNENAEKVDAIEEMVGEIEPEVAFLCEDGIRHSLLVSGDGLDVPYVYGRADSVAGRFGTPLDCLVADAESLCGLLYGDAGGNDAKRIVRRGRRLAGAVQPFSGEWAPPRPAAITRGDMLYNMGRHGFDMIVHHKYPHHSDIRAEYVIAGTHFTMEPRWYMTGFAVMMCKSRIDWHLMLYLARTYGYEGTLYGMLEELIQNGLEFGWPVSVLRRSGAEPVPTEPDTVREALVVYGC